MNATWTRFGCLLITSAFLLCVSNASAQFGGVPGGEGGVLVPAPAVEAEDDAVIHPEAPMSVPREKPDGTMYVHLRDGATLIGKVGDAEQLLMKSQFGEVSIPSRKIAVMQLFEDPKKTAITMQNGDRLTGELSLNKLKFAAEWGEVEIELKHILGLISKNMTGRYQRVQHDVVELTAEGEQRVRKVDEIVEVPNNSFNNPYAPNSMGATYQPPAMYYTAPAPTGGIPVAPFAPPVPLPPPLSVPGPM